MSGILNRETDKGSSIHKLRRFIVNKGEMEASIGIEKQSEKSRV